MSNRWRMNRMGFVNFWLYDEEIFSFSDGKLLLRGQNGSGKSITTQSFIPFILDGDRSPNRLDPFGSSDRRMEYYFLGESGKNESTGYLFLEFKRENLDQYRTIGIGQRAQKGKPMSFWGFVILDGRRIGVDFNLYKEIGTKKIPYTKQELRRELGENNPYTETQREYMELVNKYIFGFANMEQYSQFIKLLIKVRAPKLSKEFKPTKVYDILNDSLQTLSDEDLRAMVEAMEKMDDIQSRLDSLKSSYKDLHSIKEVYSRYNLYMLGKKARAYVEKKKTVDKAQGKLKAQEIELEKKNKEIEEYRDLSEKLTDEIGILAAEKESLHLDDMEASMEKLENERRKKKEAEKEKYRNNEIIEDARTQILRYDAELRSYEGEIESVFQEIEDLLEELEDENTILLFEYHEDVRNLLDTSKKREKFQQISHSLERLENRIKDGYQSLENLNQISRRWSESEEELQEYLVKKERVQSEYVDAQNMQRECKDRLIESLYDAAVHNQEMKFTKDELEKLSGLIQDYENTEQMGEILEVYHEMWMQRNHILVNEKLEIENKYSQAQRQRDELAVELKAIEEMPMAIPARRREVEEVREILREKKIPFIPFYEAVDFADGTSESEKKRVEGQIEAAGFLDALIIPDRERERVKSVIKDFSDIFISVEREELREDSKPYACLVPENLEFPLREAVEDVLKSISDSRQSGNQVVIAEDGYFKNGILEGYCNPQEEASYIGAAARKRKKEELLQMKKEELIYIEKELADFSNVLEKITLRIQKLEEERLPSFEDLNAAMNLMKNCREKLEQYTERTQKKEEAVAEQKEKHRNQEQQVMKICKGLPYFRTLEAYGEAYDSIRNYKGRMSDLKDMMSDWETKKLQAAHKEELRQKEEIRSDEAYDCLKDAERRMREADVQIQSFEEYLNNPEMKKIRERLEYIRNELNRKDDLLHKNEKQLAVLSQDIKWITAQIQTFKEEAVAQMEKETRLREYFEEELALKLVMEQEENSVYDTAVKAQTMVREKDQTKTAAEMTAILIKTFHGHLGTLTSYGIAMEEYFSGDSEEDVLRTRQTISATWNGKKLDMKGFYEAIKQSIENTELLIRQKDRELFEGILADTLSRKLSNRIRESRSWIKDMSKLMKNMDTSMALTFSLEWKPKGAEGENELDTQELEKILGRERELLTTEDIDKVSTHFRTRIYNAKRIAEESGEVVNYIDLVRDALDYRQWFKFEMHYYRNDENKRELTNGAFNRFSGGEKAMAMYIPLFAAVNAQYKKAENPDHPRMIALDEAFAGVDDKNISSMFELVEKMDFDYIMNSQVLWGCYQTVKSLKIAELLRPSNSDVVTVIYYSWNGFKRTLDEQ